MPHDRRQHHRIVTYRAATPGPHGELYEVEYDAEADALHFACRDLREGRREPLQILEDGVLVYDADGIRAECERRDAET